MGDVLFRHRGFSVRHWRTADRETAAGVIKQCLEAYGLAFEPEGGDLDALEVESHYLENKSGEFWVVVEDSTSKVMGTAAYYEIQDGENGWDTGEQKCVEIRKMFLLPEARGKQLGRVLLQRLEEAITSKGYQKIFLETASVLREACHLYESAGYLPVKGGATERCDRRLCKDILVAIG